MRPSSSTLRTIPVDFTVPHSFFAGLLVRKKYEKMTFFGIKTYIHNFLYHLIPSFPEKINRNIRKSDNVHKKFFYNTTNKMENRLKRFSTRSVLRFYPLAKLRKSEKSVFSRRPVRRLAKSASCGFDSRIAPQKGGHFLKTMGGFAPKQARSRPRIARGVEQRRSRRHLVGGGVLDAP